MKFLPSDVSRLGAKITRRDACATISAFSALAATSGRAFAQAPNVMTWNFDNLNSVGGFGIKADGAPKVVDTAAGKAIQFDGVKDGLIVDKHPLENLSTWTLEAMARFDAGGELQPRWVHLGETDPATGLNVKLSDPTKPTSDGNARFTFEGRIKDGNIWFESFCAGPTPDGKSYSNALIDPAKTHPLGQWVAVSQTYDGKVHRAYVNGVLEQEKPMDNYIVQKKGRAGIGMRQNRIYYFKGLFKTLRYAPVALSPDQLLKVPDALIKNP